MARVTMTFEQTKRLVRKGAVEVEGSFRQMRPVTYIEVFWTSPDGKVFTVPAHCECGYKDKWSPQAGRNIAFGMATAAIARKYRAYARRHDTAKG